MKLILITLTGIWYDGGNGKCGFIRFCAEREISGNQYFIETSGLGKKSNDGI